MGLLLDSWWNIVLVAIFGSCIYLYDWCCGKLKYFDKKKIPHVKFTVKQYFRALTKGINLDDLYHELYESYPKESYVGFYRGLEPSFIIRDPKLVNQITNTNFNNFPKRWRCGANENIDPIIANLMNLNGETWQELRFKLNPLFTSSNIRSMFPLMQSCANSLIQQQRKTLGLQVTNPEEDIDAKQLFSSYNLAVSASCIFAIEQDTIKDPESEFRRMIDQVIHTTTRQEILLILKISSPYLPFLPRVIAEEVEEYFVGHMKKEIHKRRSQGSKRQDFIQLLVELQDRGFIDHDKTEIIDNSVQKPTKSSLNLTNELLTAQMLHFFLSGYVTTNQMAAVACYHLSRHNEIQERVRNQIREAKKKHQIINFDTLKDIKLIDYCIMESLRLMPIRGSLMRVSSDDFDLGDGNQINKGTKIIIPVISLHNDSNYWQNPDKYMPERFIDSNILSGTYLPFGLGPRSCIGQNLALIQTKLILVKMIENFQILPGSEIDEPFQRGKWFDSNVTSGVRIRLQVLDLSTM